MKNPKMDDYESGELGGEERKGFYSSLGKILVFLALTVSVIGAAFGIIQLFALSESGLTPDLAWKERSYEETSLCGSNIVSQVSDLSLYYRLGVTLGTDGEFDPEKEVDLLVYTGGGDTASDNTTYTVSELAEMREYAEDLYWLADEAVYNYAYNDAGINKQKFLDYQDGYYETDTFDESEVSEAATESTEAFSGEDA
ncbi:MAG: hypothetical protein SOT28_09005, partial [Fusicatenibacter sp.]|nr:hypothetical protein [Fusicatenibacter sp.]